MPRNFGVIGVGGYIAPRHLRAIHDTGNRLIAAVDTHDAVGVMDRFFPDARFFTEIERFDRHLEKLRRKSDDERAHYISVCTPNYLHDSHIRLALRLHCNAICEKPLVINPWNLDPLEELEEETGCRVYNVLQLRLLPELIALKEKIQSIKSGKKHEVSLTYVTSRGPWYQVSWKGVEEKSGGVATNIGIHFFDLLMWLFGKPEDYALHLGTPGRMAGWIELERANVRWFLSVDRNDLPESVRADNRAAFRSLTLDGEEIVFSDQFTELHTQVYRDVLEGRGFGIKDARPAIQLVHDIRTHEISGRGEKHDKIKLAGL
jgi:UDP-N-acetyl-2-amino-2-deoxyglucuronate dehydrogenase